MDKQLKQQLFNEQFLHDFNPQENWHKKHRLWIIGWFLMHIIFGMSLIMHKFIPNYIYWILFCVWIGFTGISFWVHFDLTNSLVATNWDNMDYQNFHKMDFPFVANDGTNHAAYLYVPKTLDFSEQMTPHKTIISFHGWGSHHREMDRYCLPAIEHLDFLYFTLDSFGLGQTVGNKNDFTQFHHAKDFIEEILELPFVDKLQVAVIGMSLGGAKAAFAAYPNPHIRAVIMLSSPFDLILTKENMTKVEYLIFRIFGFSLNMPTEKMHEYSTINLFVPEGIQLSDDENPTSNNDRVYILANEDDPAVTVINTYNAIAKLQLRKENYRIFPRGKHSFKGNEPFVAMEIYKFLERIFTKKELD